MFAACLIPSFICKFLHIYTNFCIFMQSIMINRNNLDFLQVFCFCLKRSIFLPFRFSFFFLFWIIYRKQKQKRKSRFLPFCQKTSVFVANKTLIFSNLYLYRVIYTPPPRFWHSQGGSALIRFFIFFYFFYFYFFVKYSDFSNSAFLPNFEYF